MTIEAVQSQLTRLQKALKEGADPEALEEISDEISSEVYNLSREQLLAEMRSKIGATKDLLVGMGMTFQHESLSNTQSCGHYKLGALLVTHMVNHEGGWHESFDIVARDVKPRTRGENIDEALGAMKEELRKQAAKMLEIAETIKVGP